MQTNSKKKKKAGVAVLINDKIGIETKAIVRDKEGHYMIIKGIIQQEDIILVNIYIPDIGAPKYVNQIMMDIKAETDSTTFPSTVLEQQF